MIIQNDKISLRLNGAEDWKKNEAPVPFAREGRISNESLDVTMDCAVQQEKGKSVVYTEAELKQLNNDIVESWEDETMSPADFISRCMTGEDAKALSDEETPLEEYTSSQLERALSRVKEQRSEKQEAVENQVEKEQEKEKAREKAYGSAGENAARIAAVCNQLSASNLPVTEENVEKVAHAADMAMQNQNFTDNAMKFFIGNAIAVTPENISGSVYGASGGAQNLAEDVAKAADSSRTAPEDTFAAVEQQVQDILTEAGLAGSESAMEQAKWLYENDLPVTAENIVTLEMLQELKNLPAETILVRIADSAADGISPEKADLAKMSREEAQEAVNELLSADDSTLRNTFTTEADFITAKRQLEEIRLMMTAEAAREMAAKGISLDITNLQNIVEELKIQERQAKEALLAETGLSVTAENASVLSGSVQAAKEVLAAPVELLGETIRTADSETLASMAERGTTLKEEYDKAARTYEAVGTEVRKDLGDSIRKAFSSIEGILEDLGLENTARNQRAVRILGYNQMDLTREHVEEMKAYDARVTGLMERMKPQVVAKLIEDGMNPLELSLDELESAVDERYADVVDEDISFRKFLWKMDHYGDISEEERQSMIGVYRLLDKIEKSDGAVIGQVIKEGRELSLSAFLSATRTKRAEGMDVSVDDNFGALEQMSGKGTTISAQIGAAYSKALASDLQKSISPAFLKENADSFMDMSLENLLESCQEFSADDEPVSYYEHMAAEIKDTMADADGQLQRFLQELELPDTIAFRMAAKEYMSGQRPGASRLWTEEESREIQENFDNPEQLEEIYAKADANHEEKLEKEKESDDITYDDVISLARMARGISFYQTLRSRQMYEVPIVTGHGVTNCHVTIQSTGSTKGSVEIFMDSDELGKVQATFRVRERHVKGFVTAEYADSMEKCREILENFEKDLEEMGYTMDSDSLVKGSRASLHAGDRAGSAKNKDLYFVAKCFITNIAGKDDES